MSTGLESQHNGYEPGGAVSTGPLVPDPALHEELQRANEKLKAQLAAARREIEHERQRAEQLRRESENRLDSNLSELEHIRDDIPSEREASDAACDAGQAASSDKRGPEDLWVEDEVVAPNAVRSSYRGRMSELSVSESTWEAAAIEPECVPEDTAKAEETLACGQEPAEPQATDAEPCDDETAEIEMCVTEIRQSESYDQESCSAAIEAPCDDEDSIEAHIAAFMTRMRGGASNPVIQGEASPRRKAAVSKPSRVKTQIESTPVASPAVAPKPASTAAVAESAPLAELERRARADVKDLAAMRALANTHAQLALHTHSKNQLVRTLCMRAIGSAVCLIVGFIALNLTFINKALDGCAMMVIVAGIYFLFLATEDAKKVSAWLKSRPVESAPEQATSA